LGGDTLHATAGHPFWVVGQGWRSAKFLKVDDIVHGRNGAVRVEDVAEDRPVEVYNLVVSDYHNYFVGEQQVLVHDNSPLVGFGMAVPGLKLEVPRSARVDHSTDNR